MLPGRRILCALRRDGFQKGSGTLNGIEVLLLNMDEVQRRALKVWQAIPEANKDFRPDPSAMSLFDQVVHAAESDAFWHHFLSHRSAEGYVEPQPPATLLQAMALAEEAYQGYRAWVASLRPGDLSAGIERPGKYTKTLADYIQRTAFHKAVHIGQALSALRIAGLERPNIWD